MGTPSKNHTGRDHKRQYTEAEIENMHKLVRILKQAREERGMSQRSFAKFLSAETGQDWKPANVQWSEEAGTYPPGKDSLRLVNENYLLAIAPYTGYSLGYLLSLRDGLYAAAANAANSDSPLASYATSVSIPDTAQELIIKILDALQPCFSQPQTDQIDAIISFLHQLKK